MKETQNVSNDRTRLSGRNYDRKMYTHFNALQQQAFSRRGLLKAGAGIAGAGAMMAPMPSILPGIGVLAQDGETLTFGLESDPRAVEPALGYDFTANVVICNITEGPMMVDTSGALQVLLAESFEQPDQLTYIYNLRPGVKFHDGTDMTAADLIASIERVRNPAIASPMAWMFDPAESIEATGDMQVTITLAEPSGTFQYVLSTTAGHVMPKSLIDSTIDTPTQSPIGTGPYKFDSWEAGSEITLQKHDEYWQEGKPFFQTAVFKIITDPTTRTAGLSTGELQMVRDIQPDQLEVVQGIENVELLEVIGYTCEMVVMRNDQEPFNDANVRKAVSMAIDVPSILTNLYLGAAVPANSTTVPPTMPGSASDQLTPVAYDVEGAKAALAESAFPDGFDTKLLVDSENTLRVAEAQAIQQMLLEIGVNVEIEQVPQADRITAFQTGEYEGMAFHEWGADFPDANGMLLPLFLSASVPPQNNQSYYSNPDVDTLLNDAEAEGDAETRTQMLIDAQKLIAADMPLIWLDHNKWFMAKDKSLTGYTMHPLFYWDAFLRDLTKA
jgi:peptide/nickel transport system substrate-binding protein